VEIMITIRSCVESWAGGLTPSWVADYSLLPFA